MRGGEGKRREGRGIAGEVEGGSERVKTNEEEVRKKWRGEGKKVGGG